MEKGAWIGRITQQEPNKIRNKENKNKSKNQPPKGSEKCRLKPAVQNKSSVSEQKYV